jgi:hypothetical protein
MKPAQFVADANASGPSSGKPDDQELREVVTTLEAYRPVP